MKAILAGIQWMIFMIAGAIAAPLAIADLFQLTPNETTTLIQNTIFILGISGFLQGVIGHKLPIHEGPAGLWWSVFTIYASLVGVLYISSIEALQALSGGMMISGGLFILLAAFRLIDKIALLFTPTITFIYLFLLILQLSGTFMKGMMGITSTNALLDVKTVLLSVAVIGITFWLGSSRYHLLQRFSVMISIFVGWLLFILFGRATSIAKVDQLFELPSIFPYGGPIFDAGTIMMACFLTLLLITNVVASIRLMEMIIGKSGSADSAIYSRSGFTAGINQLIGGGLGAIASVPISGAAGFVQQTNIRGRMPFIIGCSFVILVALFPPVMSVVAAIPAPIGYAVTFVIFTKMVGLALKELKKVMHEERTYIVCGVAIMVGVGLMFIPPSATANLPPILIVLLNNGLIFGSILAILLEQILLVKARRMED